MGIRVRRSPMPSCCCPAIREVLDEAGFGFDSLDSIVFGRGPGSYTSLRIGIAAVQGIAWGAELPVVPVSSLAAVAQQAVDAGADEVLVLSGDTPLLTTGLLQALIATHRAQAAAATVLSFVPSEIRSYGRIVRGGGGDLEAIVEAADASPEQLATGEANSSIYFFRRCRLDCRS